MILKEIIKEMMTIVDSFLTLIEISMLKLNDIVF